MKLIKTHVILMGHIREDFVLVFHLKFHHYHESKLNINF